MFIKLKSRKVGSILKIVWPILLKLVMSNIGMTEILEPWEVIEQEYDYALWCAEKKKI